MPSHVCDVSARTLLLVCRAGGSKGRSARLDTYWHLVSNREARRARAQGVTGDLEGRNAVCMFFSRLGRPRCVHVGEQRLRLLVRLFVEHVEESAADSGGCRPATTGRWLPPAHNSARGHAWSFSPSGAFILSFRALEDQRQVRAGSPGQAARNPIVLPLRVFTQ